MFFKCFFRLTHTCKVTSPILRLLQRMHVRLGEVVKGSCRGGSTCVVLHSMLQTKRSAAPGACRESQVVSSCISSASHSKSVLGRHVRLFVRQHYWRPLEQHVTSRWVLAVQRHVDLLARRDLLLCARICLAYVDADAKYQPLGKQNISCKIRVPGQSLRFECKINAMAETSAGIYLR